MRPTLMRLGSVLFVLLLLGAACAPAAEEAPDETPVATEAPTDEAPEDEMEEPMALPGEGRTVRLARANWDTGYFQAEIFRILLQELGYDVTAPQDNELGPEVFYPVLAQGTDLDMWVNGWFPLHDEFLEAEVPGTGERVGDLIELVGFEVRAGALQGWLADKATVDEHGIERLEELRDPEVAALFDSDGNGMANLVGCNPGWGCEQGINLRLEALELTDTVEHTQGAYSSLMVDTLARVQRGDSALYYTWTPNWTVGVLQPGVDVMWLQAEGLPDEGDTSVSGLEGCTGDPCQMGWGPNDIRVVANSEFLDANPAVRRLAELVEIPLADISGQNARMIEPENQNTQADIERHAAEWVEQNRDLIDGWIADAIAAAG